MQYLPFQAMSDEQLSGLLARLKEDAGLREKLKTAADLDAILTIARDAGFDVSKSDWLRLQARQALELSDEELEEVAGGISPIAITTVTTLTVNSIIQCPERVVGSTGKASKYTLFRGCSLF